MLAVAGGAPLPETRLAFDQMMERVGPTDVYRLFDQLPLDKLDLDQLLAVLRMTAWDPVTFISMSRDLNRVAGDAYLEQLARLREALQKVWALHFPLPNGRDVAFEIGYVYYAMRRYREAMAFYQRSLALHGESRPDNDVRHPEDRTTHFTVNILPHTAPQPNCGENPAQRQLNVELDVLARYLQRMRAARSP